MTVVTYRVVSSHLFRRTARARKRKLERRDPRQVYSVTKAERGPWRWQVRRLTRSHLRVEE